MIFYSINDPKKVKTITVANPREDLTKAEATAVMQQFVDKKDYANVTGVKDAYMKESVVTQLA
ncbi:MAG: DUF2922 family protein [Anaerovibrio sp.]|nr:DUF2922 family protein [Anaerovibrio sp.]